jgi:hypothetical protein
MGLHISADPAMAMRRALFQYSTEGFKMVRKVVMLERGLDIRSSGLTVARDTRVVGITGTILIVSDGVKLFRGKVIPLHIEIDPVR